jgi:hypothetical protein
VCIIENTPHNNLGKEEDKKSEHDNDKLGSNEAKDQSENNADGSHELAEAREVFTDVNIIELASLLSIVLVNDLAVVIEFELFPFSFSKFLVADGIDSDYSWLTIFAHCGVILSI